MKKLSAGLLVSAAMFSLSAQELEVNVGSGTASYTTAQLELINGGTVTEIRKTGAGTLHSSGIAGFVGIIRVSGGVLKVSDATGLGTAAGKTVVEDGATLHFDTLSPNHTIYKSERYEIAGNGFNSSPSQTNGAIRITGATCQLNHLTLTGDTALYSANGFHFYDDGNSSIDMGGKTLRFYSVSSGNVDVEWQLDNIVNPGHIEIHNARYFSPTGVPFPGGEQHEVRLYGRTGVMIKSKAENKTWSIIRYGTGGAYQSGANGTWNGPVENRNLESPFSLGVGANNVLTFNGPLKGAGSFLMGNDGGKIVLNGTNTFSGVFEVKSGRFVLGCPEAAAGSIFDRFKFTNLTVSLGLTAKSENWPCGWSTEAFSEVLETCRTKEIKNISVSLHAREGDSVIVPVDFEGDYTAINIGAVAGGEAKLAASFDSSTKLSVQSADPFIVTRQEGSPGCGNLELLSLRKGTLIFDDAGLIDLGTGKLTLGANNSSELSIMYLRNNTVLTRDMTASDGYIALPECDIAGVGLYVEEGAVVTNRIQFSIGQTAGAGALYVCGGEVFAPYTVNNFAYIGGRGQALIDVSSGIYEAAGPLHLGVFASGIGQLRIGGGAFSAPGSALHVGEAGTGTVYHCAGTASLASLTVCSAANQNSDHSGYGAVTVTGSEAELDVAGTIIVNNRSADSAVGILNISDGATVKASNILKSANAGANARAFVNVDGGIVKVQKGDINLFDGVDKVSVYGGGITIDTDGHDVSLQEPLSSPGAGALASVSLDASKFKNIVTPPHIVIAGDGEGASAMVVFDSATRTIKGVVVTSPGSGYTAANTKITAVYKGRVNTSAPFSLSVDCTFTLTDEYAGVPVKLTKRGEGKLTLGEGVLPAGALVSVEGGSVGGEGFAPAQIDIKIGQEKAPLFDSWPEGAKLSISNLGILGEEPFRCPVLSFASSENAVFPELAAGLEIPEGWKLRLIGKTLRLVRERGFSLLVR